MTRKERLGRGSGSSVTEQRKEYLRQNSYPTPDQGPISYADALKKNLKFRPNYIPMEDVFEAWRDYLGELDDLLTGGGGSKKDEAPPAPEGLQLAHQEVFPVAEGSLEMLAMSECGKPTVRTTTTPSVACRERAVKSTTTAVVAAGDSPPDEKRKAFRKSLQPEEYFAAWRHNLTDGEAGGLSFKPKRGQKYVVEEYFRVWRRNLYVREYYPPKSVQQPRMMPENIFNDWIYNLNPYQLHYRGSYSKRNRHYKHRGASSCSSGGGNGGEPLSNKSRSSAQRRSKNKKNKNSF